EIDPNDITSGLPHELEKRASARAKVDRRHARSQMRQHGLRVRQHKGAVVGRRQGPDPAIEQLHDLSASRNLAVEIAYQVATETGHERMPGFRLRVHQGLSASIIARSATLN